MAPHLALAPKDRMNIRRGQRKCRPVRQPGGGVRLPLANPISRTARHLRAQLLSRALRPAGPGATNEPPFLPPLKRSRGSHPVSKESVQSPPRCFTPPRSEAAPETGDAPPPRGPPGPQNEPPPPPFTPGPSGASERVPVTRGRSPPPGLDAPAGSARSSQATLGALSPHRHVGKPAPSSAISPIQQSRGKPTAPGTSCPLGGLRSAIGGILVGFRKPAAYSRA
jgi:hypothetical protein